MIFPSPFLLNFSTFFCLSPLSFPLKNLICWRTLKINHVWIIFLFSFFLPWWGGLTVGKKITFVVSQFSCIGSENWGISFKFLGFFFPLVLLSHWTAELTTYHIFQKTKQQQQYFFSNSDKFSSMFVVLGVLKTVGY